MEYVQQLADYLERRLKSYDDVEAGMYSPMAPEDAAEYVAGIPNGVLAAMGIAELRAFLDAVIGTVVHQTGRPSATHEPICMALDWPSSAYEQPG